MFAHPIDLSLGLSFALGFLHAIEPGHGKTALFIHASGGNRSRLMPLVMGISTGVSHTISLLGVAVLVHLTTHAITGDHLHEDTVFRWMQGISVGVIIAVGLWIIATSKRTHGSSCSCCGGHEKHEESRDKLNADKGDLRLTALLGAAVGLLPCPSALAAYFAGISEGDPGNAYWVVGAFGLGIAISLILIGSVLQRASERLTAHTKKFSSPRGWAIVRGGLFVGLGVFYAVRMATDSGAVGHVH